MMFKGVSTLLALFFSVILASASVLYVDLNSTNPIAPYSEWNTSATNIQDAVDAASPGDQILVTNGVYQVGGRVVYGLLTNRVVVNKPLVLQSVNGPAVTTIQGYSPLGDSAVRCAYLTNGACLVGFTLNQGGTRVVGDVALEQSGGGVWCESSSAMVSNCVISGNVAFAYGGGSFNGKLVHSSITGNLIPLLQISSSSETGGAGVSGGILSDCAVFGNHAVVRAAGAFSCTLNNCSISNNTCGNFGGAVGSCTLSNCTLAGNYANSGGGAIDSVLFSCKLIANSAIVGAGACNSTLYSCFLVGNSAQRMGGGVYNSAMNNCTVTENTAFDIGGGAYNPGNSNLNNCIIYYNSASREENYFASLGTLNYCCTTPAPFGGVGSIGAAPQFIDAPKLNVDSPCLGAGSGVYAFGTDVNGRPWSNPPSVGCEESNTQSVTGPISVAIQADRTNSTIGIPVNFKALINGDINSNRWDFGDGTVLTNNQYVLHSWEVAGEYKVILQGYNDSNLSGVESSITIHVTAPMVYYVSLASTNPTLPFASWETAATNIQDAVDAASTFGALVLVSNGVYNTGGRVVYGTVTNRVAVTNPIVVMSFGGPDVTTIEG